jgi:hypothetical protein
MATKTTLNALCADVILCIFEYFTVNEIYDIFSQVIPNLTSLLINSHVRLHLRNSKIPPIDPAQVISIDLPCLPRLSSISLSEFINLRSLILHDMEDPRLLINQPLSQALETLYLNVSLRNQPPIILLLLSLITQLPRLKSYTLMYPSSYFVLQKDSLILQTSSITIKNLKLDFKCSISSLEKLLKYLPYLHRLQTTIGSNPDNISESSQILLLPNIQHLCLLWDYIPFQDILKFCKKMINLKTCIFNVNDHRHDPYTFDPIIWRKFIERDHVSLKRLTVNMKLEPPATRKISDQLALHIRLATFVQSILNSIKIIGVILFSQVIISNRHNIPFH